MPNGTSSTLAPSLLDADARVIDLAGDFRLPADQYPEWYGFEHQATAWLDKAVYGLPELFAERIAGADLVANPGCFSTAAIISLAPLVAAGLVGDAPIMVDGKSGLSGAGRSLTDSMMFSSAHESVRPYRFPKHQHTPEIENAIGMATGHTPVVSFVPHLVPAVRGVLTTSYITLADETTTTEQLNECLFEAYRTQPFVRVLAAGEMADTKRVRGSNVVEIHAIVDPRTHTAAVVAAEDNLVKGAAGQAIQNFNIMTGRNQATGLPVVGVYP
jgi:N-acetyl-gamma-glutamyl-phosphate reductase